MNKIIQFGENVEGYNIPVLNERETRAAAGILFTLMFTAILTVIFKGNFLLLKYAIVIFLTDISIRVFINPKFAPTLIIGRWIVRNQNPEYVGAPQKKFAWVIGFILGLTMLVLQVIVNAYSPITGIICLICLIFLLFEAAFGICLGCKFYPLFFKDKVQYCPGEVCEIKDRQEIQKTSSSQWFILLSFSVYIFITVFVFNENFAVQPYDLFGIDNRAEVERNKTLDTVKILEEKLKTAMLNSDVEDLDKLISDDLIFTNHLGQVMKKEDDINAHKSGFVQIETINFSDQKLNLLENSAVVSVNAEIAGSFGGETLTANLRFTRYWAKNKTGEWQLESGHSTLIQ